MDVVLSRVVPVLVCCPFLAQVLVHPCAGQVLVRHGLVQDVVHRADLSASLAGEQTGCYPAVDHRHEGQDEALQCLLSTGTGCYPAVEQRVSDPVSVLVCWRQASAWSVFQLVWVLAWLP